MKYKSLFCKIYFVFIILLASIIIRQFFMSILFVAVIKYNISWIVIIINIKILYSFVLFLLFNTRQLTMRINASTTFYLMKLYLFFCVTKSDKYKKVVIKGWKWNFILGKFITRTFMDIYHFHSLLKMKIWNNVKVEITSGKRYDFRCPR